MKMSDGYADACRVGLETAIQAAGGQAPLAKYLRAFGLVKVTPKTIAQWVGTHLPKNQTHPCLLYTSDAADE